MSLISKAKSKGHSPDEIIAQNQRRTIPDNVSGTAHVICKPDDIDSIVAAIYKDYEKHLTQNNSLDFDDLLLYGVKLFSQHQRAVRWCKHVLVDEL
jgi:DNA helicase-2/ATP-dependent DNA helicase PcrA